MTIPVLDGHNDTLLHIYMPIGQGRTFFEESAIGHLDLPRARKGGFAGGFFACFVPADVEAASMTSSRVVINETGYEVPMAEAIEQPYAHRVATALTASLFRIEEASDGQVKVVRTADELADCVKSGVLAAILHFEGAEPIDTHLDALEVFYRAGLRSLGPVWSRPNAFGCGVPFKYPCTPDTGSGLTEAGRALIKECNRLGVMIDLSHINEHGFWDVADLSDAPLVATHSNAHSICPSTRNLTDKQLDAIKESDGMVGLSFTVSDLRPDGYNEANTPLTDMVRHIDYMVSRIGIDRVGFGSDFDGTTVPTEIGDVTGLPRLLDALAQHGFDEPSLRKLAHENWIRVLRKTWKQ
jgi:membrane dipeptidase